MNFLFRAFFYLYKSIDSPNHDFPYLDLFFGGGGGGVGGGGKSERENQSEAAATFQWPIGERRPPSNGIACVDRIAYGVDRSTDSSNPMTRSTDG